MNLTALRILYNLYYGCKKYENNIEVLNIYKKISREILDKEAEKYIQLEKLFYHLMMILLL